MSSRGFTLIELMIVIGIIGIVSAVTLFGWRGYQDNANLRTAVREVMSDIASCRQRSVSEGVNYCIQFTDGSPNYSINVSSCGAPTQTPQAKNLRNFGSGLTIRDTNFNSDQVIFRPRGTSSLGDINLINSKGSRATITINMAGRAHVSFTML
jgi:type II secretion system protein H